MGTAFLYGLSKRFQDCSVRITNRYPHKYAIAGMRGIAKRDVYQSDISIQQRLLMSSPKCRSRIIFPVHIGPVIAPNSPAPKISAKYQNTFRSPAVISHRNGENGGAGNFGRDGSEISDGH